MCKHFNTILHGTDDFTKLFDICFIHLNDTAKLTSAVKNFPVNSNFEQFHDHHFEAFVLLNSI